MASLNVSIKTFAYTLDYKGQLDKGLRDVVRGLVEGWAEAKDDELAVVQIQGGITNLLYRLQYRDEKVLVRIFGEKTELMIERERDNQIFQILSDMEYAPKLYGVFDNGRIEGFLPSRSMTPDLMASTSPVDFPVKIAKQLARLHNLPIPEPKGEPFMWKLLTRWENMVSEIEFPDNATKAESLEKLNRAELHRQFEWMRQVLPSALNNHGQDFVAAAKDPVAKAVETYVSDIVFCHNDLLSGNILVVDGKDDVVIIDYEYGGYNYRGFDLANHFCEYAGFDFDLDKSFPRKAAQVHFLEAYVSFATPNFLDGYSAADRARFFDLLAARVCQIAVAPNYFWGLWAVIQGRYSPIDFDFMGYAHLRFGGFWKFKAQFHGPPAAGGKPCCASKPAACPCAGWTRPTVMFTLVAVALMAFGRSAACSK